MAKVVQYVTGRVQKEHKVLGSDLGQGIKDHFPIFDLKASFGKLTTFVDEHCPEVRLAGKRGLDNLYVHRSYYGRLERPPAWLAFSNPRFKASLLFDKKTGRLLVSAGEADRGTTKEQLEIEPLSSADYRQMAEDFLEKTASLSDSMKTLLSQALREDAFWEPWSVAISTGKPDGTFYNWMEFRQERILQILADRLRRYGLEQGAVESAQLQLLASKKNPEHKASTRRQNFQGGQHQHSLAADTVTGELRVLLHQIIDRLGPDQIRNIWLPLGEVLDALGSSLAGSTIRDRRSIETDER